MVGMRSRVPGRALGFFPSRLAMARAASTAVPSSTWWSIRPAEASKDAAVTSESHDRFKPAVGETIGRQDDRGVISSAAAGPEAADTEVAGRETADVELAGLEAADPELVGPEVVAPEVTSAEAADVEVVGPDVVDAEAAGTAGAAAINIRTSSTP